MLSDGMYPGAHETSGFGVTIPWIINAGAGVGVGFVAAYTSTTFPTAGSTFSASSSGLSEHPVMGRDKSRSPAASSTERSLRLVGTVTITGVIFSFL